MKIFFLKDCGIYKKGDVLEVAEAKGSQYITAKFAKIYEEKPKTKQKTKSKAKKK